jgi:hypothetical protein
MKQDARRIASELGAVTHDEEATASLSRAVHESMIKQSRHMRSGDYPALSSDDVALLFRITDEVYFEGRLGRLVEACSCTLTFHQSSRLTRSGGVTKQIRPSRARARPLAQGLRYEITLSSHLLLRTFAEIRRPVQVCGLACVDRLQATQRVLEHEMTHLAEMLLTGTSSCSAPPFRSLVRQWFGHREVNHDLVTQAELAREVLGIRVGDTVSFSFHGQHLTGLVNRITRRATVLVEDPSGELYTTGKRYLKYYVPLQGLMPPR